MLLKIAKAIIIAIGKAIVSAFQSLQQAASNCFSACVGYDSIPSAAHHNDIELPMEKKNDVKGGTTASFAKRTNQTTVTSHRVSNRKVKNPLSKEVWSAASKTEGYRNEIPKGAIGAYVFGGGGQGGLGFMETPSEYRFPKPAVPVQAFRPRHSPYS